MRQYKIIIFCWIFFLTSCGIPLITVVPEKYDTPKFKLASIPKKQSVIYFQRLPKKSFFDIRPILFLKKSSFDAIKTTNLVQKYDYTAIVLYPGTYFIQTKIGPAPPLIEIIEYTFSEPPKERFLDQLMITVKPNQHYFIQQDGEKLTLLSEVQGLVGLAEKYYIKPYFSPISGYQEEDNKQTASDLEYQGQIKKKYPLGFSLDKKAWAEKLLKEHPTKALIWIYRPAYLRLVKETPTIFYNEQELFDLKDGTYTVIMVESGIHQLKSDWLFLMRRATNLQLYFQGGSSYFFRWHVYTGLLQLDESLALTELPSTRYIPPKFGAIPHYESEFRNSRAE